MLLRKNKYKFKTERAGWGAPKADAAAEATAEGDGGDGDGTAAGGGGAKAYSLQPFPDRPVKLVDFSNKVPLLRRRATPLCPARSPPKGVGRSDDLAMHLKRFFFLVRGLAGLTSSPKAALQT